MCLQTYERTADQRALFFIQKERQKQKNKNNCLIDENCIQFLNFMQ